MNYSKYNIFSKIKNSENFFLINNLSGNADILDPASAQSYINEKFSKDEEEEYRAKGYIVDAGEEKKAWNQAFLDFIDKRGESEIQLFYVPSYSCNFRCSYCYQHEYPDYEESFGPEITDSFFNYIDSSFSGKKKYLTLFGGEPLMGGTAAKEKIKYFLEKSSQRNLGVAVVTNGYYLADYIPLFKGTKIREIQVTLDGPGEIHDSRRFTSSGEGTFKKISEGIDKALDSGYPINLRVVVDRENLPYLPALADYASEKGWTENTLFKTQLGRNYELHTCAETPDSLFSRVELYEEIYKLAEKYPQIIDFHKPAFSVSRFLFENGELPDPLFDSCPGCKTEWAFDSTGRIFSCTATVGKEGQELGTFYPEVSIDRKKIEEWEERSVLTIPECTGCQVQLACGGGCAAVAINRTGKVKSPDCRPVKELLEMGISLYFENNKRG